MSGRVDRLGPTSGRGGGRATPSRIGLIVTLSMALGLALAVAVVVLPLVPAEQHALTGAVLLAFGLGWAALAVLSVRLSDQPQRWAVVPAVFLALAGLAALGGSDLVHRAGRWVWPPVLLAVAVWAFLRARQALRSRSRRWVAYPVIAVLGAAALGGGYETVREALDARAYPPPGRLIDVGGHRLHVHCTGTGAPTVVLEPGLGAASSNLAWVTSAVAGTSRVCVYDRAGRGWSEPADGPQDAAHIAADLQTLLDRADIPGPYVLAGHSFGGWYTLSFAAQFPGDVAGMVLIDSTAPNPRPTPAAGAESSPVASRLFAVLPALAHLGVQRVAAQLSYGNLPPDVQGEARANGSTARALDSTLEEVLQGSASGRQAASLTGLGAKPLVVLTADKGHDARWLDDQKRLATLSSDSDHRLAPATHESLVGDSADSAATSRAIADVVLAVRTSRPLARR